MFKIETEYYVLFHIITLSHFVKKKKTKHMKTQLFKKTILYIHGNSYNNINYAKHNNNFNTINIINEK